MSLYLAFHLIQYISSNYHFSCRHISLTAKLQFPIFIRDKKRPEIRFGFEAMLIEYPVAAVTMDVPCNSHPCEGPLQVVTCTADRRCHLCGDPVSNKAMTGK